MDQSEGTSSGPKIPIASDGFKLEDLMRPFPGDKEHEKCCGCGGTYHYVFTDQESFNVYMCKVCKPIMEMKIYLAMADQLPPEMRRSYEAKMRISQPMNEEPM